MTAMTKRLLLGAGAAFLLSVLVGVIYRVAYDDAATGTGPTILWIADSIFEVATLALLIGAGLSFLVARTARIS